MFLMQLHIFMDPTRLKHTSYRTRCNTWCRYGDMIGRCPMILYDALPNVITESYTALA
jgi:hypothetical protein